MSLETKGYFGWTKEVQLGGGIRYLANSSQVFNGSKTVQLRQSGLESFFFQVNYMLPRKKTRFISNLEFLYRQVAYTNPLYDNRRPYSYLVLGDGSRDVMLGARFYYGLQKSRNGFWGNLFYNIPSDDFSSELLFELGYNLSGADWALLASIGGKVSLGGDKHSNNPSQKPPSYTGSTYLYNSVNQSFLRGNLKLLYKVSSRWRAYIGYGKDLNGKSTDLGSRILAGLNYRVDSMYQEGKRKGSFKGYDIEAMVQKASSQNNYVMINKGFTSGIKERMFFDFFVYDFKGGNKLVARGAVVRLRSNESIIRVTKWFSRKRDLGEGIIVRGRLVD